LKFHQKLGALGEHHEGSGSHFGGKKIHKEMRKGYRGVLSQKGDIWEKEGTTTV